MRASSRTSRTGRRLLWVDAWVVVGNTPVPGRIVSTAARRPWLWQRTSLVVAGSHPIFAGGGPVPPDGGEEVPEPVALSCLGVVLRHQGRTAAREDDRGRRVTPRQLSPPRRPQTEMLGAKRGRRPGRPGADQVAAVARRSRYEQVDRQGPAPGSG